MDQKQESLVEQLQEGSPSPAIVDISKTRLRFFLLICCCLLCFGNYFVYDNPSALQPQIEDVTLIQRLGINGFEFNMLYSIYSYPNIVLPLFGGYLVDSIGIRTGVILFSTLICAGQAVFALGCSAGTYWLALVGRLIFGLGGESLGGKIYTVTQSTIISNWFAGQEISLAFGLTISISRLGSVANDLTEPALDSATGSIDFGLWFGLILCGISFLFGLIANILDKRRDRLMGFRGRRTLDPADRVNLRDIKTFDNRFWLICINCVVVYICVMPFNNIASAFYQDRFNFSSITAGWIISITYIISAIFSPFLGFMIDRIGKRVWMIILSAGMMTLTHLAFLIMPDCDQCVYSILPLILLGFGYSIYASVIWASIPYVVMPKTVGTAFGLGYAVQNAGLGFAPMIIGAIYDGTDSYTYVSLFLFLVGICGIICGIFLAFADKKKGGVLNSSDPRQAMLNCVQDDDHLLKAEEVDQDLPENAKKWLSSPQSQKTLRRSIAKSISQHQLVIMAVQIFLLFVIAFGFQQSEVKPSSFLVDMKTTYTFAATLDFQNAEGQFVLTFPGQYSNLDFSQTQCQQMTDNNRPCIINSCNVVYPNILIQFECPDGQIGNKYQVRLNNVPNPKVALTTSSFTISSQNIDQTTTYETVSSNLTLTFQPRQFASILVEPQSLTVGEISQWNITVNTQNQPQDGSVLEVAFPSRFDQRYYCLESSECSEVNIGQLPCTCNQQLLSITISQAQSTALAFRVTNIRNPPSTTQVTGITIKLRYQTYQVENSDGIDIVIECNQPAQLTFNDLQADSTEVSEITRYLLQLQCDIPVPMTASITLQFPENEIIASQSISTGAQGVYGLRETINNIIVLDNNILLTDGFYQLTWNDFFSLYVTKVQNPITTQETQPIQAIVKDENNGILCQSQTGITFIATPASFSQIQVTPESLLSGSVVTYTFQILPEKPLPSGAVIQIEPPQTVKFNDQANSCQNTQGTLSSSAQCTVSSGILTITNGLNSGYLSGMITFKLSNVRNPLSTRPSNTFKVVAFQDSQLIYKILESNLGTVTTQSTSFTNLQVNSISDVTGTITGYDFTIDSSIEILQGSSIFITLPTEILIIETTGGCENANGFNSSIICSLQNASISIQNGFQNANQNAGQLSFRVNNIRNPQSTKPVQNIEFQLFDGSYISQIGEIIGFNVNTAHNVQTFIVQPQNQIVGQISAYNFVIDPFNPLPNGVIIEITPPDQIELPISPACSPVQRIDDIECQIVQGKLIATLTIQQTSDQLQFQLQDVRNPLSLKPTDDFWLICRINEFKIDERQNGTNIQITQPGQIQVQNIQPEEYGISQITIYTFSITLTNQPAQDSYLQVTFPSQISITNNFQCFNGDVQFECQKQSQQALKLSQFTSSTSLQFRISNLQNFSQVITTSQFTFTTYTNDNYKIDEITSYSITFTCYDPCLTCESQPLICTSCNPSSQSPYFWDGGCNNECKQGTLDIGNSKQCTLCDSNCKACQGSLSNCTECNKQSQYPYLSSNICVEQCTANQLTTSDFQCLLCSDACLTCDIAVDNCTSCKNPLKLYQGTCVTNCPDSGTVQIDSQCLNCSTGCTSCALTQDNCTGCVQGLYLYQNKCLTECPQGITIAAGNQCVSCSNNCKTCQSQTDNCISCEENLFILTQSNKQICTVTCPTGYTQIDGICQRCSSQCYECSQTISSCTSCNNQNKLYQSTCIAECPEGETVEQDGVCLPCLQQCNTCETSRSQCTSCISSKVLFQSQCLDSCPSGTYKADNQCLSCNQNCQTCTSNATNCQSCKTGFFQYKTQCLVNCPEGITVPDNGFCIDCDDSCSTCQNIATNCLSCPTDRWLLNGQCLEDCPQGYVAQFNFCEEIVSENCAEGCSLAKLQNEDCDPECNFAACDFDGQLCLGPANGEGEIQYDDDVRWEEYPLPLNIVNTAFVGSLIVAKIMISNLVFYKALIGIVSTLQAVSIFLCAAALIQADDEKGRELLEIDNEPIMVGLCLMVFIWILWLIMNYLFLAIYYAKIVM